MAKVEKSVLALHPAERMFELVDRVEDYPQFLPWCGGTQIRSRDDAQVVASVGIDYHGLRQQFTTRNTREVARRIVMRLEEGPFSRLSGEWRFIPLNDEACKIEFSLEYEFASRLLSGLISPVFDRIANTFVDAFVQRADAVEKGGRG